MHWSPAQGCGYVRRNNGRGLHREDDDDDDYSDEMEKSCGDECLFENAFSVISCGPNLVTKCTYND